MIAFPLSRFSKKLAFTSGILSPLAACSIVEGALVNIGFNSAADYDNNFWISSSEKDLTWRAGGYLTKDDGQSTSAYAIYNSHSTGGVNGSGGIAGGASLDEFVNFRIQTDYRINSRNTGAGMGFYVKANNDLTAGYLVLFRTSTASNGTGSVDVRIWGPDSQGTDALGTSLLNSTIIAPTSATTLDSWYTFRLDVLDLNGQVKFVSSMWDPTTNLQVGNSVEFIHAENAIMGAGQVGVRLRSGSGIVTSIDNFVVDSIPEPSGVLLGLAGMTVLMARRKRTSEVGDVMGAH